ncbi:MAG: TIGR03667 family PPOX class F420-dependent oxidoreductase [Chloroflexota bacterium]|nr:TIGR03667 family PPOX class F420-dependent oxidoreductase [Chloroflexota bacterium]
MPLIDTTTEFGKRVQQRLDEERVIWLITVGSKSEAPQPNPIWFVPEGPEHLLIYTIPGSPKLHNISVRPKVALNFNSTVGGGDVVIFQGEAKVDDNAPAAKDHAGFIAKYRDDIGHLGMTPESFSSRYSTPVRVRMTRLRGE